MKKFLKNAINFIFGPFIYGVVITAVLIGILSFFIGDTWLYENILVVFITISLSILGIGGITVFFISIFNVVKSFFKNDTKDN